MNLLLILLVSVAVLLLGGRFYAPLIARLLGERLPEIPVRFIDAGMPWVQM